MSNKYLVGVYGSLKKGYYNHRVLGDSKLLGTIKTNPAFTMYSLGPFPALSRNGNTAIHMEIYEVDEQTLHRLYRLEGYSGTRGSKHNMYDTMDIDTPYGKAEIFYMTNENHLRKHEVVKDGNWKIRS